MIVFNLALCSFSVHLERTSRRFHLLAHDHNVVEPINPTCESKSRTNEIVEIVFPTDFSQETREALDRACRLALSLDRSITIFHKIPSSNATLFYTDLVASAINGSGHSNRNTICLCSISGQCTIGLHRKSKLYDRCGRKVRPNLGSFAWRNDSESSSGLRSASLDCSSQVLTEY